MLCVQRSLERSPIEKLVSVDHILRKIDKCIDDQEIRTLVQEKYSKTGRPSLDPTLLFRAMVIAYLFGIRSDRMLCRQLNENLAYRWFCGLGFEPCLINQSCITKFRDRVGLQFFFEVFNSFIRKYRDSGIVLGKTLIVDATFIKANASLDSLEKIYGPNPKNYKKKFNIKSNSHKQIRS